MNAIRGIPARLRTRRRMFLVGLAAIILAAGGAVTLRDWTSAQEAEPWPAFTMTWRETANGLGLNGAQGTQLFRLEYTDRRHHRTTLLENPTVPDAVGSTWTVGGDRSVVDNVRHKLERVTNLEPEVYSAPAEWLAPGRIAYVRTRAGYTTMPLGAGLARLIHEATFPDGRTVREETTYRVVDLIPMLRVTLVNGVEVSRHEVIDFKLGTP